MVTIFICFGGSMTLTQPLGLHQTIHSRSLRWPLERYMTFPKGKKVVYQPSGAMLNLEGVSFTSSNSTNM